MCEFARCLGSPARFLIASGVHCGSIMLDRKELQTTDQMTVSSNLLNLGGGRALFPEEIRTRVAAGARLVRFEFCLSALFFTVRRQSPVYLTESWQDRYLRGIWYSLTALVLGPWGVPWGLIWTPWAVWVNLTGGVDETEAVLAWLDAREKGDSNPPISGSHNRENRC